MSTNMTNTLVIPIQLECFASIFKYELFLDLQTHETFWNYGLYPQKWNTGRFYLT